MQPTTDTTNTSGSGKSASDNPDAKSNDKTPRDKSGKGTPEDTKDQKDQE